MKARGEDVLLLLPSTKAISETELAVAVVACLLGGAGLEFGSGLLGRGGCVKGYDCAVAETGALAKGSRC